MIVQRLDKQAWRVHQTIDREISDLIRPSYDDPTALLERELARNDRLYFARDEQGRLAAFFMVARESVNLDGESIPTVWLGLSATSQETKGTGLVRYLYRALIADARCWERALNRPLLMWATTAAPSVYQAARLLFADLAPANDGSYPRDAADLAHALRRAAGYQPAEPLANPFVLRGVATDTRYAASESARLQVIQRRKQFDLFERLGVSEAAGDRLMLICRVPAETTRG